MRAWPIVAIALLMATPAQAGETFTLPSRPTSSETPAEIPAPRITDPNPLLGAWDGPEWEYLTASPVPFGYLVEGRPEVVTLKDIGNHGWELVGVDKAGTLIFKRPKRSPAKK